MQVAEASWSWSAPSIPWSLCMLFLLWLLPISPALAPHLFCAILTSATVLLARQHPGLDGVAASDCSRCVMAPLCRPQVWCWPLGLMVSKTSQGAKHRPAKHLPTHLCGMSEALSRKSEFGTNKFRHNLPLQTH